MKGHCERIASPPERRVPHPKLRGKRATGKPCSFISLPFDDCFAMQTPHSLQLAARSVNQMIARRTAVLVTTLLLGGLGSPAWASDASPQRLGQTAGVADPVDRDAPKGILVEVFLSPDRRDNVPAIKREFEALSVTRVRPQVFRLGHPPKNIAIGRDVPASVAQLAIRLAVEYNDGVDFLLPEYRFFPRHVAIGSSAFDEASQIPITPENLARLRDPALTTEQFHALYRSLTGEDKQLPTYLK